MSGSKVTSTGAGNLVLRADNTGTGQGTVVFNPGGHVDYTQSTGTVSLFYNPSGSQTTKYQNPTNYFCPPCPGGGGVFVQQPSQLTAYMLVNTAGDLDAVRTNQSGTYALGTNITFDPNQTFTPIPNFTGLFDGQGQVIANLTIASTAQNIGLFGTIASAGEVRNLNLTNVSVSADSSVNSQLVGTLAGINAGTIANVSATGQVQVGSGSTAGGLVGQNLGTIVGATLPALDSALRGRSNLRLRRDERGVERFRGRARWLQQRHHHECVRDRRRHRRGRYRRDHNAGRARRGEPGLHLDFVRLWRRGKFKRCQSSGGRLGRQQCRYNPVVRRRRQRASR